MSFPSYRIIRWNFEEPEEGAIFASFVYDGSKWWKLGVDGSIPRALLTCKMHHKVEYGSRCFRVSLPKKV